MLNYRHLYYFWVVTKQGGFARAAERLDMAVQTISAQVRELEKSLGHQLLKPAGRGVALTEAGQAAFARAEEIFQLGQLLPDEVREAASGRVARLAVGMSDGISKLAAHALLEDVYKRQAFTTARAWSASVPSAGSATVVGMSTGRSAGSTRSRMILMACASPASACMRSVSMILSRSVARVARSSATGPRPGGRPGPPGFPGAKRPPGPRSSDF